MAAGWAEPTNRGARCGAGPTARDLRSLQVAHTRPAAGPVASHQGVQHQQVQQLQEALLEAGA